jgi:hypothetical protein
MPTPTNTRAQRLAALRAFLVDRGWTVETPNADTTRNADAQTAADAWLLAEHGIRHRNRRRALIARACRQLRGEVVADWQRGLTPKSTRLRNGQRIGVWEKTPEGPVLRTDGAGLGHVRIEKRGEFAIDLDNGDELTFITN